MMRSSWPSGEITCRVKNSFLHFEEKLDALHPGLARSKSWSHPSCTSESSSFPLVEPSRDVGSSSRIGGDAQLPYDVRVDEGQASSAAADALLASTDTDGTNIQMHSKVQIGDDLLPSAEDNSSPVPLMSKCGLTSRVNVTQAARLRETTVFSLLAAAVSIGLVAVVSTCMSCHNHGNAASFKLALSTDSLHGAIFRTELVDVQSSSSPVLDFAYPVVSNSPRDYADTAISGSLPKDVSKIVVPSASFAGVASVLQNVLVKVSVEDAGTNLSHRHRPSAAEPSVLGICFRLRGRGGSECSFTYKLQWSIGKGDLVVDRGAQQNEHPCHHYELRWHDSGTKTQNCEYPSQVLPVDQIKLEEVGTSWSQPHQTLTAIYSPAGISSRQPAESRKDKDSLLTYKLQWQNGKDELMVDHMPQRIRLPSRYYELQWKRWQGRDQFCRQQSSPRHTYELRW
eukprot:TRINITY_DN90690_c0_g1_i1.p1 TRINITY_DN90690_c0_g1~~TRINITY_DN90690_c0_g1_i1.p1  ORF type:complete len:454 (+),score=34.16 TRINITY_DN90690_c0_g1_i1:80-1441(+)